MPRKGAELRNKNMLIKAPQQLSTIRRYNVAMVAERANNLGSY